MSPLLICRRAGDQLETKLSVESHGLIILLVDNGRDGGRTAHGVLNQSASGAASLLIASNEKSLDRATGQHHESDRLPELIQRQPSWRLRQELLNFEVNRSEVFARHERMCVGDGGSPYRDEHITVFGGRFSDLHVLPFRGCQAESGIGLKI